MTEPYLWPDELLFDRWGRALFCLGPGCTKRLAQPKTGRPRRFCSERCRVSHKNRRNRKDFIPQCSIECAHPYGGRG